MSGGPPPHSGAVSASFQRQPRHHRSFYSNGGRGQKKREEEFYSHEKPKQLQKVLRQPNDSGPVTCCFLISSLQIMLYFHFMLLV